MKTLSLPKDKIRILLLEGIHPKARDLFEQQDHSNIECGDGSLKFISSLAQLVHDH